MRPRWLGVAAFVVVTPAASAQQLHYEGALSLTSGTYLFTERTNSWTLSTGLAFAAGPVTFRASLPMFVQNTTLLTSSGGGLVPTGGSSSGTVADSSSARRGRGGTIPTGATTSSLSVPSLSVVQSADGTIEVPSAAVTGYAAHAGDPLIGATAAVSSGRLSLLLGASAKVPLNDSTGYGTGAWDFGGSGSLSYLFGLTTMISVDAAYWVMGDLPELDLQNPLLLSASLSFLGLSGWGVSGSLSTASPVIDGYSGSTMVTGSLLRVGRSRSLGLNIGVGLSAMAPDVTVGLTWRMQLTGR
ncbi:MAG: hypothetical protein AMS20_07855 [Gemmatimonas sp. SG8_28]|nr:MAG: hypothetical protein AMS20_07855 [Gemmatimonas sp. SG8_28]